MATIFDSMNRGQLIIAAFFSTPKNQRFMSDADRPDETPELLCSLMQVRPNLTLGDLDTDGLRAYVEMHGSARPRGDADDLRNRFLQSCDEAIRKMSDAVV